MRMPLLTPCAIALSALFLLPVAAVAQSAGSLVDEDRYHIVELADGVMRIDRQTGEVSECNEGTTGWVCRLSADDRTAYEAEINRLTGEMERLEEQLAVARQALEEAGGDLSLLPETQSEATRERMGLPSNEEIDAVVDTAEEAMRRFMGMVEELRRENEAQRGE